MVVKDHLSAVLNDIMNCKKAKKMETVYFPVTKLLLGVLEIMKKHGYIEKYKVEEEKFQKVVIKIGRINKCGSIKPRFYVKRDEAMKYVQRYLPARDFGILIISTNKGLLTHQEAIEQNIGGSLIAYCY
ncbi:MAG: 30S ribosomal protein S8 [Candidatus Pacearchaeota archaeon]|nr:30S ribosomal protein S8 [Candidatus Pacearchaeota archaeon]